MGKFKFPTAYTILFILIALVAVMTWIVPAGKYQMAMNATLGKKRCRWRERMPPWTRIRKGLPLFYWRRLTASITTKPYTAGAIDVALFVLIIGGFLGW